LSGNELNLFQTQDAIQIATSSIAAVANEPPRQARAPIDSGVTGLLFSAPPVPVFLREAIYKHNAVRRRECYRDVPPGVVADKGAIGRVTVVAPFCLHCTFALSGLALFKLMMSSENTRPAVSPILRRGIAHSCHPASRSI
jgi:hypothetical protein